MTPSSQNLVKKVSDYCKKNNLPVLKNILTPRTKGFELIMETSDAFEYFTDITIAYERPYEVKCFYFD